MPVARSAPKRRRKARASVGATRAAALRRTADSSRPARTAIIDIGSNTIRLVVYEGVTSLSAPLFNEKIHCELARGLADSGRLNPKGRARAMAALSRFARLARKMGAGKILAVATAAARVAKDGESFVASIRRRFRINVRVLSGAQDRKSVV